MPTGRVALTHEQAVEKFWSLVNMVDASCWEWLGHRNELGYGLMGYMKEQERAHRLSWLFTHDEWPDGEIDHLCRNPSCVRPDHLRVVPNGFNIRQGQARAAALTKAKTHCPRGHEYAGNNIYHLPGGRRDCRTCKNARNRAYRLLEATLDKAEPLSKARAARGE